MNNLFNYLTKPRVTNRPELGVSYSPIFDLFNTLEQSFAGPFETFSNDNIRFNETKESSNVEIDLPGVKKEDLKVTYNDDTDVAYVEAKRTITTKTGSKEETYNRSFRIDGGDFDVEQLNAKITDGVLRINVPRLDRDDHTGKEHKVINVKVA
jgi:HSP20 family protein